MGFLTGVGTAPTAAPCRMGYVLVRRRAPRLRSVPSGRPHSCEKVRFQPSFSSYGIILEVFSRKGNVHRAGDILCMRDATLVGGRPHETIVVARLFPRREHASAQRTHM